MRFLSKNGKSFPSIIFRNRWKRWTDYRSTLLLLLLTKEGRNEKRLISIRLPVTRIARVSLKKTGENGNRFLINFQTKAVSKAVQRTDNGVHCCRLVFMVSIVHGWPFVPRQKGHDWKSKSGESETDKNRGRRGES